MSKSDWEYVNFSQDHELNHILDRFKFSRSIANRQRLKSLERAAKASYGKNLSQNLTHGEFYEYIKRRVDLGSFE